MRLILSSSAQTHWIPRILQQKHQHIMIEHEIYIPKVLHLNRNFSLFCLRDCIFILKTNKIIFKNWIIDKITYFHKKSLENWYLSILNIFPMIQLYFSCSVLKIINKRENIVYFTCKMLKLSDSSFYWPNLNRSSLNPS